MSRDLERLWADDPPRQQRESEEQVATPTRIWGDELDTDAASETRPSPDIDLTNDLEELRGHRSQPPTPPSSNGRRASRQNSKGLRRRQWKVKRVGLFVAGGMLLLLVADGVWAGLTIKGGLEASASDLRAGVAALQAGEIDAARSHFTSARDRAGEVDSSLGHPSTALASITPGLARNVDVIKVLREATTLGAEAGLTAVRLAEELGVTSEGFAASLYSDGRVDLDSLGDAEPFLAELGNQLSDARALLNGAPEANISILTDALQTADGEIGSAEATARKSSEMFAALPTLLGAEEKQKYFLAFQALSEARGTGGLIGLWGVLVADNGKISLKKVAPIGELTSISTPTSSGPKWYEERYGPFGALMQWQQSNFSPNLPVVSEVLLERFDAAKRRKLDGVVTMDPIALGLLTRGTGPVSAPGLDLEVTEDNAHEILLRSVYEDFESNDEQNAYLSALITSFWESIESGDVNAPGLLSGVGEATSARHLAVYSSDRDAQRALVNAEAAGTYDSYGPNVQMVFHNNLAASKVDYFLRRTVDTNIKIEDDGSALVTTSINVSNGAPSGGSALLKSEIKSDAPGLNRLYLSALLPKGAQPRSLTVGGEYRPEVPDVEDGFPTVWDVVVLESDESATMKVVYRLPNALRTTGGRSGMDLTLIPQPTVAADSFSIQVQPPSGFTASIEGTSETSRTTVEGELHSVRTFTIQLLRQ